MLTDTVNYLGAEKLQLVYDSGATKSTVNNLELLIDPVPITKSLNTYGGAVSISHVGKLNFGGTIIHPVYYSESGPRNLISTTQLEDHGMNVIHSHRKVQIRLGEKIIFRFYREGDLNKSGRAKGLAHHIRPSFGHLLKKFSQTEQHQLVSRHRQYGMSHLSPL
ncbi:uncharacterized protein MELLADRAFT_104811 [Melampsora larici-populina 98AG31]|uniref:Uncharacterized protein n=1 Tax=Melampsora larici-populina (strain 98AG31 / pathotype 3-4-7) TaxID=747676 RepID=F4RG94_MELLP|nr:uncharacterized protein MELLADRAFT_104811 [Melampsora larici-populina 98AG31]EGG08438.1 hypothetical protein MELLADRAFT_104811 [Melampsora larici-populina 98AG31]